MGFHYDSQTDRWIGNDESQVPGEYIVKNPGAAQGLNYEEYSQLVRLQESQNARNSFKFGEYIVRDSGKREEYTSGMQRDITEGKPRYDLIYKPMLKRWAELMSKGVGKYGERNWEKADSVEELMRFLQSAERHLQQLINVIKSEYKLHDYDEKSAGEDKVEDHAAAVLFNIAAAEHVRAKLK